MNTLSKSALAALALGLAGAAPAAADYSLVTDAAYPSVIYVEYDPSTMPTIYTAPGDDPALPIIRGGAVDQVVPSPSGDVQDPTASTNTDQQTQQPATNDASAPTPTMDETVEKTLNDLANSTPQQIENRIIQRKVEGEVLKDYEKQLDN